MFATGAGTVIEAVIDDRQCDPSQQSADLNTLASTDIIADLNGYQPA